MVFTFLYALKPLIITGIRLCVAELECKFSVSGRMHNKNLLVQLAGAYQIPLTPSCIGNHSQFKSYKL